MKKIGVVGGGHVGATTAQRVAEKELCEEVGFNSLTLRRVSTLINELDLMGIINAKLVSLGRYGRTKKIILKLSGSDFKDAYIETIWLKQLFNYESKYIKNLK